MKPEEVETIAEEAGMILEVDNDNQMIVFTGIPEGAPEKAQIIASLYGWQEDVDNYGQIILFTNVYDKRGSKNEKQ
tara:strand:+ start:117 stop:344 length:228 start_codon:yes stop_codon:yes gene_type:complete